MIELKVDGRGILLLTPRNVTQVKAKDLLSVADLSAAEAEKIIAQALKMKLKNVVKPSLAIRLMSGYCL